jgi:tetrahydromethanopterin S-methyltransferase subunit E
MIQNLIIAMKINPVLMGIILITIGMLIIVYIIIIFNKKVPVNNHAGQSKFN